MQLKEVVLFADQVDVERRPLIHSEQGQVYFATDKISKKKVVIKQINIGESSYALIKEL